MVDPARLRALLAFALACALVAGCGAEDSGSATSRDLPAAELIASPALPGSGEPNLFAAGGHAYLSWIEPEPVPGVADTAAAARHRLRFAEWDGGGWSVPITIASGAESDAEWFVNWADFPSLVRLPAGRLAAHWLERTGGETYAYGVRIATSDDGGRTWSDPVVPHRDGTPTEHGFVSLFPTPSGELGVVWLDGRKFAGGGDSPEMTLRAAAIDAKGEIRDEALLDGRACDCCQTGAAVTARGPLVVYRDRSAGEVRDIAVVRLTDGGWTEPATLHADGWTIDACPVNGPAVAAREDRVAVAWFTAAGDTARVNVAFSADAGATFGPPVRVDDGAPGGRVDVGLLPDGSALVSWIERVGGGAQVRVRRVAAGGEPGPSIAIAATSEERASGFPQMALAGGDVLFAWTEPGQPAHVRTAAVAAETFR